MKNLLLILCLFALTLTACEKPKSEIASPLIDNQSLESSLKSSYRGSLLEQLYAETLKKDSSLKSLEEQIQHEINSPIEAIQNFETYNNYSGNYYSTALSYAESIKDSLLKNQLLIQLDKSEKEYKKSVQANTQTIEKINQNREKIRDLHMILKIVKTLSIIEEYQKINKPEASDFDKSLEKQLKFIQILNLKIQ